MFLLALVLFSKDSFEPMCLFFSEPLIHELRLVIYKELVAATVTPERTHFLEVRYLLLALPLLYCHGLHLLNFSGSAELRLLPLPLSNLSHKEPPNKTRADRYHHDNDVVRLVALG
jgi:hypothetical protein